MHLMAAFESSTSSDSTLRTNTVENRLSTSRWGRDSVNSKGGGGGGVGEQGSSRRKEKKGAREEGSRRKKDR